MKKLLGIVVLGLLWCSSVYAAKDDGVCGLQSQLSDMTDASLSIKIAEIIFKQNFIYFAPPLHLIDPV